VQAAIRDSEMVPMRNWLNRKSISMAGGVTLFAAILSGTGWFIGRENASHPDEIAVQRVAQIQPVVVSEIPPQSTEPASAAVAAVSSMVISEVAAASAVATTEATAASSVAAAPDITNLPLEKTLTLQSEPTLEKQHPTPEAAPPAIKKPAPTKQAAPAPEVSLLQQRLDATQTALATADKGSVSIQLFYTDDIRPERMERFLGRAQRLGKLAEIYIVPIKLSGRDGYRVLYGLYANSDAAREGIKELPQRYKDAFAPTLHMPDNSQNMP
jgi:septal ring-binding cell division protein DamX